MTHDEMTDALRAGIHPRDVYPQRAEQCRWRIVSSLTETRACYTDDQARQAIIDLCPGDVWIGGARLHELAEHGGEERRPSGARIVRVRVSTAGEVGSLCGLIAADHPNLWRPADLRATYDIRNA